MPNFVKMRPVGAELFHVNGRMERHAKANSRLCETPKKNVKISLNVRACYQHVKSQNTLFNASYIPTIIYALSLSGHVGTVNQRNFNQY